MEEEEEGCDSARDSESPEKAAAGDAVLGSPDSDPVLLPSKPAPSLASSGRTNSAPSNDSGHAVSLCP